jgi:4-aminobutyrate aminotransferase-like enzyme
MGYGAGSDTWSAHPLGCASVIATLDVFEQTDVMEQAAGLSKIIEESLVRLCELPAISAVRGEGTVWGIECTAVGEHSAEQVAHELVRRCYVGNDEGKAIHLLGPLAGKVVRIAPPLTMDHGEARDYFQVLHEIAAGLN